MNMIKYESYAYGIITFKHLTLIKISQLICALIQCNIDYINIELNHQFHFAIIHVLLFR